MRALVMGLAALAIVEPAVAQALTGVPAAGEDTALQVCAPCHVVADRQVLPRLASAPSFKEIANVPGMTEMALFALLHSPHPSMPNLILSRDEAEDVVAYIVSLRDR